MIVCYRNSLLTLTLTFRLQMSTHQTAAISPDCKSLTISASLYFGASFSSLAASTSDAAVDAAVSVPPTHTSVITISSNR